VGFVKKFILFLPYLKQEKENKKMMIQRKLLLSSFPIYFGLKDKYFSEYFIMIPKLIKMN